MNEVKIKDSGIWAIFWILFFCAITIGPTLEDINNSIKAQTDQCTARLTPPNL